MKEELIDILHYLLRKLKAEGADDIVLSAASVDSRQIKFVNNKVAKTGTEIAEGIGIFSAWNKRIVETNVKEPSKKNAERAVKQLKKLSAVVPENKMYEGIAQGPFKYQHLSYDARIGKLDAKIEDIVEDAINAALSEGAKRTTGILETTTDESFLLTSGNVEAMDKDSNIYLSFRAFSEKNSSGHRVAFGRRLDIINPKKTAKEATIIAKEAREPSQGPTGKFDVIFEPLPFANLLEHVGVSASIFQVETGLSFLKDKLGNTVGSDIVTIVDDGLHPDGAHSTPFDSEGVPTKHNIIIDKGVFRKYLHNTSTARRHKTETTANAGLISPHPWNTSLEPGDSSVEEMIRETRNGIYVTNIWYTRFQNFLSGDFSTIPGTESS